MPYRLSFENAVRGIRFQPIYSVAEKAIKAREILSLLQPGINHEQYFASQSDQTLKWSTKLATALEFFSIGFLIRLALTHHYIRAVLVRCNIQRYSPLLRELHR